MWYRNSTPACAPQNQKWDSDDGVSILQHTYSQQPSSGKNLSIRKEKMVHVYCICVRKRQRERERERFYFKGKKTIYDMALRYHDNMLQIKQA